MDKNIKTIILENKLLKMKYRDIMLFARELRKSQTKAEKYFWRRVRGSRFYGLRFQRQFIIEHSDVHGEKNYFIVDFYCHRHRLVIEIDGEIHNEQEEWDLIRTKILEDMDSRVIRFSNEKVLRNWCVVEMELKKAIGN